MASTTALPPPTSIEQGKRPANFTCRLCFATRPVPVGSSAGCLAARPVPVIHRPAVLLQGLCRSASPPAVLLQRPCFALPCLVCLPLPWPHACCPLAFAPVHYHVRQDHRACCRDCPVGSRNTGLHWRLVHRVFVCTHPSMHPLSLLFASPQPVFCRDCPVGSHNTGLHWRPVHRFVFTALISRGRPRTAFEQPATFPVTCIVSRAGDCV